MYRSFNISAFSQYLRFNLSRLNRIEVILLGALVLLAWGGFELLGISLAGLVPVFALPDSSGPDGTTDQFSCSRPDASGYSGPCGNPSCGGTSSSSTPFAYVWDGKKYVMDNDVMFGKPLSRFPSLREGKHAYQKGGVRPDLYALQTKLSIQDGLARLQIKEIEPEVSALDHVRLLGVNVKKGQSLFVKSDFSGYIVAKNGQTKKLTEASSFQVRNNKDEDMGQLVASYLSGDKQNALLETGDHLDVQFKRSENSGKHFLLLDSWYRDWTLGNFYLEDAVASPFRVIRSRLKRSVMVGMLGAMLGFLGWHSTTVQKSSNNLVAGAFAAPSVHADGASCSSCSGSCGGGGGGDRSLEILYWNGGSYRKIDVIEPRYARPSTAAIAIPEEAFDTEGIARMRILATKRHKVSGLALAQGVEKTDADAEFTLHKAVLARTGVDYVKTLSKSKNDTYLETLPGDVIDMEFKTQGTVTDRTVYLLAVGGVYTAATQTDLLRAGDWTTRLDPSARRFLNEVYHESHKTL